MWSLFQSAGISILGEQRSGIWDFAEPTVAVYSAVLCVSGDSSLFYYRLPLEKKYWLFRLMAVLLAAGALGNLVDRILHKYVVDFIYFSLIHFPIFNVADCCVVTGGILMLFNVLVVYKEEDYFFLKWRRSR